MSPYLLDETSPNHGAGAVLHLIIFLPGGSSDPVFWRSGSLCFCFVFGFVVDFWDWLSCSPGWVLTGYVGEDELFELFILLPLPLSTWIKVFSTVPNFMRLCGLTSSPVRTGRALFQWGYTSGSLKLLPPCLPSFLPSFLLKSDSSLTVSQEVSSGPPSYLKSPNEGFLSYFLYVWFVREWAVGESLLLKLSFVVVELLSSFWFCLHVLREFHSDTQEKRILAISCLLPMWHCYFICAPFSRLL